ncbi:transporter substrate-binding domain-containing protein [Treponema phagedenis]|uniref:transporter substrate-binding domain-containing protein n=1 Tax=Treponema phagedenis TaxID=162 RepID=UPI0001F641F1|nr:transporter substrate-binding domain-containing protein [Treponema phagedenis]EFW39339.1 ABC transporter, substrate-binding protein, family 3 [Treponema phagedenis F0421]TYT77858.1 transporter substrate-binding domain-containing protein [Treponema phagedenis]
MKKIFTIFFLIFLISSCQKNLKSDEEKNAYTDVSFDKVRVNGFITVGVGDPLPPLISYSLSGYMVGYDIDLLEAAAKKLHLKIKVKAISWDEKEAILDSGEVDCIASGLSITPDREEIYAFTQPYLKDAQVIVTLDSAAIFTFDDLVDKCIGIQKGSTAAGLLKEHLEEKAGKYSILELDEFMDLLVALENKKTDAIVVNLLTIYSMILREHRPYRIFDEPLATDYYAFGFRHKDIKLRDMVQKALERIQFEGTVKEISTKWFGNDISIIKIN